MHYVEHMSIACRHVTGRVYIQLIKEPEQLL